MRGCGVLRTRAREKAAAAKQICAVLAFMRGVCEYQLRTKSERNLKRPNNQLTLQVPHQAFQLAARHFTPRAAQLWDAVNALLLPFLVSHSKGDSSLLDGVHRPSRARLLTVRRSLPAKPPANFTSALRGGIFRCITLGSGSIPDACIAHTTTALALSFVGPLLALVRLRVCLVRLCAAV